MPSKKLRIEAEMGNGADRIGELPDAVLVGILSLLPMTQAAMAGTLSRRWRRLSNEHMLIRRELDFVGGFRHLHSPEQFVEKVSRCLQLHTASKVERLHVSVALPESRSLDLERWVAFAVSKGVEDLALDFTPDKEEEQQQDEDGIWWNKLAIESGGFAVPPGSLRSISLTRCELGRGFDFSPLGSCLQRASFRGLNMKTEDVRNLLSRCTVLESLRLWECGQIGSVVVGGGGGSSSSSSRLKELVIANCSWYLNEVIVTAPSLRSFQYYGDLYFDFEFHDISGLEDALLSCVDRQTELPDHDCIKALRDVSHAKILTLCHSTPMIVSIVAENPDFAGEEGYLPVPLDNLEELQLLTCCLTNEYLGYIYDFFRFCPTPLLQRVFIRLPGDFYERPDNGAAVHPPAVSFHHLKTVKMNNFYGTEPELNLALFFLERAPLLEKFVLVAPRSPSPSPPDRVKLANLASKASSPDAQLVFCEFSEDSSGLNPTHIQTYDYDSIDIPMGRHYQ